MTVAWGRGRQWLLRGALIVGSSRFWAVWEAVEIARIAPRRAPARRLWRLTAAEPIRSSSEAKRVCRVEFGRIDWPGRSGGWPARRRSMPTRSRPWGRSYGAAGSTADRGAPDLTLAYTYSSTTYIAHNRLLCHIRAAMRAPAGGDLAPRQSPTDVGALDVGCGRGAAVRGPPTGNLRSRGSRQRATRAGADGVGSTARRRARGCRGVFPDRGRRLSLRLGSLSLVGGSEGVLLADPQLDLEVHLDPGDGG